jgi:lipoteichoic acid synthase
VLPQNTSARVRGVSRSLLNRRELVYLLSLLVPFAVYELALKGFLVVSWPKDLGLAESVGLLRSDLLFNLGYALLWVVLFAVARGRPYRLIVVFLFHAATMFVALVTMSAYQDFKVTGSMLDLNFVLFSVSSSEGLGDVVASEISPGLLGLILAVLAYVLLGPWLIVRLVGRWRGWTDAGYPRAIKPPWFRVAAAGLATCGLFLFSLLPGGGGKYRRPEQVLFAGLLRQRGDGRGRGGRERGAVGRCY